MFDAANQRIPNATSHLDDLSQDSSLPATIYSGNPECQTAPRQGLTCILNRPVLFRCRPRVDLILGLNFIYGPCCSFLRIKDIPVTVTMSASPQGLVDRPRVLLVKITNAILSLGQN